jgi:hypothetical protein
MQMKEIQLTWPVDSDPAVLDKRCILHGPTDRQRSVNMLPSGKKKFRRVAKTAQSTELMAGLK